MNSSRTFIVALFIMIALVGTPTRAADWRATEKAFRDSVLSMISFFGHLDTEVQVWVKEEGKQQVVRRLIRLDMALFKFSADKQFFLQTLTSSRFDADAAAVSIEELRKSLRELQSALGRVGPQSGRLDPQRFRLEDQLSRAIGQKGDRLQIISDALSSASASDRRELRDLGQKSLDNLRTARQKLSDLIARIQALEVERGSAEPGHQADG